MSGIQLNNPKVLKNYLLCQASEGKGKFSVKEKVIIFTNTEGLETIIPDDVALEISEKIGLNTTAPQPEVVAQPVIDEPKDDVEPDDVESEAALDAAEDKPKTRGRPKKI